MIGIPVGLAFANVTEWVIHKYVLHGAGKNKASLWSFHFHEHHKACRRNDFIDDDYHRSILNWNAQGKEAAALVAGGLVILPLVPVAPFFAGTLIYCGVNYYRVHKKSHLDPEWARENVPWHYDHHMGPNQDANWGVTKPWMDNLMGTREVYVGTEREAADLAKAAAKKQRAERLAA